MDSTARHNMRGQFGVGTHMDGTTLQQMLLSITDKPVEPCIVGVSSEASIGIMTEGGKYYQTGYGGGSQLPGDVEDSSVPLLVQL
jgi:hypothetical protein